MLKTMSSIQLSGVLLLSINVAEKDKVGDGDSNDMKFLFTITFIKTTRADYLNFEGIVGAKSFGYLTADAKRAFNHLRYAFIKAPILHHFDSECHI